MEYQVSIVVPAYNAEKSLARCVDSLLAQTFRGLEIILVDDGSTDSSRQICDQYADIYKNIRVLHQENGGLSSARNAGMQLASAKYIQFVDADDTVSVEFTHQLFGAITQNQADLAICGYEEIYSEPNRNTILIKKGLQNGCLLKSEFLDVFGVNFYSYTNHFAWNKIYDIDIIKKNNMQFQPTAGEDIVFNIQYFGYCNKICMVSESLYQYYKQNTQSITMKFSRNDLGSALEEYKLAYRLLVENDAYTDVNRSYLDAFYLRNLSSYLAMLYHPNSDFTRSERCEIIKNIVGDREVRLKFNSASNYADKLIKLITPLVKIRATGLIAAVYWVIAKLKYRPNRLFFLLRRWALK